MEGRVREVRREQLSDRHHAARAHIRPPLQHQADRAHAEDHPVTATVERQRRVLDLGRGGGRAGRHEARADPLEQVLARDIVGANHDHALAPPEPEPILGHGDGLRGARASGVDRRVRAARAEELRELAVPHREHLEQEPTVEVAFAIPAVFAQLADELVVAGEGARENDARAVAERLRQGPARGHVLARGGVPVGAHQRDAGVAQGLYRRGERELRGDVEAPGEARVYAVVGDEVEVRLAAGEADHLIAALHGQEAALARLRVLREPHELLVEEAVEVRLVHRTDAVLAAEHPLDAVHLEDLGATGQPERGARTDDLGAGHRRGAFGRCGSRRRGRGTDRRRGRRGGDHDGCLGGLERRPSGAEEALERREHGGGKGGPIDPAEVLTGDLLQETRGAVGGEGRGADRGRGHGRREGPELARASPLGHGGGAGEPAAAGGVVHQLPEGAVLTHPEVRVRVEAQGFAHGADDVGHLDGVDAEVGLDVVVEGEVLHRDARPPGHHVEDGAGDLGRAHALRFGGHRGRGVARGEQRRGAPTRAGRAEDVGAPLGARGDREAEHEELGEGVEEGAGPAALRLVGVQRPVGAVLEDLDDEAGERALGTALHEDAGAVGVHALDLGDPLHRSRHLQGEVLDDLLAGTGPRGVVPAVHVGGDPAARLADVELLEHALERLRGGRHDPTVEGVADRQRVHRDAAALEELARGLHRIRLARDHGLCGAVLVGRHHVAGHLGEHFHDHVGAGGDSRHLAHVIELYGGHLPATRAHGHEGLAEGQDAGGNERAVLAEAVPGHHVGPHAVGAHQAEDGHIDRERGGLGDRRVAEALELLLFAQRVVAPDERGQGPAQERRHHLVGFGEGGGHDRELLREIEAHADVLAALPGEEEGELAVARHVFERDPALANKVVALALADGRHDLLELAHQLFLVLGMRRHPQRGIAFVGSGLAALGKGRAALHHLLGRVRRERPQPRRDRHHAGGTLHLVDRRLRLPARRSGHRNGSGRRRVGGGEHRVRAGGPARGRRIGGRSPRHAGAEALEHHVEIRAAKTEGADAREARTVALPGLRDGLHLERHPPEVDVRTRLLVVDARREDAMVEREAHLQRTRGARGALEVADVRLHRADARGPVAPPAAHEFGERVDFDLVAHDRTRAVTLEQVHVGRVDPGVLVGAVQRPLLPFGIGRSDPLALAVGAAAEPAEHGVHTVAIAERIAEPAQHQDADALAHDEAVGVGIEGAAPVGRQRPDLGELGIGGHAHRAVGAAGDRHVEVTILQALHGRLHRRHRARARRIRREVGAAEVERVGDAAGHHVGQLAGHGVFGDGRQVPLELFFVGREDGGPIVGGQGREPLHLGERLPDGREHHADRVLVRDLATHRVAEDRGHAGAVVVARFAVAGVLERIGRGFERHLLDGVDEACHRRRDAETFRVEDEVGDEAADAGVRLVGDGLVGIPVERRIPALAGHLDDAIEAGHEVLPEAGDRRAPGETAAEADDGDRLVALERNVRFVDRRRGRRRGRSRHLHGPRPRPVGADRRADVGVAAVKAGGMKRSRADGPSRSVGIAARVHARGHLLHRFAGRHATPGRAGEARNEVLIAEATEIGGREPGQTPVEALREREVGEEHIAEDQPHTGRQGHFGGVRPVDEHRHAGGHLGKQLANVMTPSTTAAPEPAQHHAREAGGRGARGGPLEPCGAAGIRLAFLNHQRPRAGRVGGGARSYPGARRHLGAVGRTIDQDLEPRGRERSGELREGGREDDEAIRHGHGERSARAPIRDRDRERMSGHSATLPGARRRQRVCG